MRVGGDLSPPLAERRTLYSYNFSGQLTRITRPDGEDIFLDYDLETAQLTAQVPSVGFNSSACSCSSPI
jgi:YD repeat-containing protein